MTSVNQASVFAGGGYHVRQITTEEYLVEHTAPPGHGRGQVHGTLWPTRRAALEAVLRDLHVRWGEALEASDWRAVQDTASITNTIVSYFLRGVV